jgi:hypothetical protein
MSLHVLHVSAYCGRHRVYTAVTITLLSICYTSLHWPVFTHWECIIQVLNAVYVMSLCVQRSRDSAVGIATGYGLADQGFGVRVPVGARIFTSPCYPDRLWGPSNLISNEYRGLFSRG